MDGYDMEGISQLLLDKIGYSYISVKNSFERR